MKKLFAVLIAGVSTVAVADSFQDMNNNLYMSYGLVAPTYQDAKNINQWGVGGTFQSKNDVWFNADASMGQSNAGSNGQGGNNFGNIGFKAGYAFQFFNNEENGFQVIPYVSFSSVQGTAQGASSSTVGYNNAQVYNYGLGVQPEYRLFGAFKLALGLGVTGNQVNVAGADQQNFNYYVAPQVQYDIAKTVMLSAGYTYQNAFNASQAFSGVGGTNVVDFKVGYLF
jgi:hypothetical protein